MAFSKKFGYLLLGDEFGSITIWDVNNFLKKILTFKEEKKTTKKVKLERDTEKNEETESNFLTEVNLEKKEEKEYVKYIL